MSLIDSTSVNFNYKPPFTIGDFTKNLTKIGFVVLFSKIALKEDATQHIYKILVSVVILEKYS